MSEIQFKLTAAGCTSEKSLALSSLGMFNKLNYSQCGDFCRWMTQGNLKLKVTAQKN